MTLVHLRRILRARPWAWLLVLAIWLPAAQWAAATHALAHLHAPQSADHEAGAPAASCDLCAVAAAVTGGAPAPAVPAGLPTLPPVVHVAALPTEPLFLLALPAYRSRAPPLPYA